MTAGWVVLNLCFQPPQTIFFTPPYSETLMYCTVNGCHQKCLSQFMTFSLYFSIFPHILHTYTLNLYTGFYCGHIFGKILKEYFTVLS